MVLSLWRSKWCLDCIMRVATITSLLFWGLVTVTTTPAWLSQESPRYQPHPAELNCAAGYVVHILSAACLQCFCFSILVSFTKQIKMRIHCLQAIAVKNDTLLWYNKKKDAMALFHFIFLYWQGFLTSGGWRLMGGGWLSLSYHSIPEIV